MKKLLLGFVILLVANTAIADTLTEVKTISSVFSEGTSTAGFYTVEGLSQCKWGIMYIDMHDVNGNEKQAATTQFSMVLVAKTAKLKITRMDYTIASNGTCRLLGLHLS